MIVFEKEHPDYSWLVYDSLTDLIDSIAEDIDADSLVPGEITIVVKVTDMSEEEFAALPQAEV